jgi:hypothetical protein
MSTSLYHLRYKALSIALLKSFVKDQLNSYFKLKKKKRVNHMYRRICKNFKNTSANAAKKKMKAVGSP